MFAPFERMLAFRYLRSRKEEGFISVVSGFSLVGIALGVATLIVVLAVMNGFRQELYARILGMDGHVNVSNIAAGIKDYQRLEGELKVLSGVTQVTPLIEGQAMVMAGDMALGVGVRGLTAAAIKQKQALAKHIPEASYVGFDEGEGVFIGYRMAQTLRVTVGDTITLLSPKTRSTVLGSVPRMKSVTVAGVFDIGMYEYDSSVIVMPLALSQLFFQLPGVVNVLEMRLEEPMQAGLKARQIAAVVGPDNMVYDWQRTHAQFVNALHVERNVMFLILTLIILVAAFNIISSLIMLVKDKENGIAILRTMGASKGSIMRIFFLCGSSIGVIGTLSGAFLGLMFALNIESIRRWLESLTGTELFAAEIYFLSTLPAKVNGWEVAQVVGMALVLTFLATLYPSWRAARTEPAQALKYGG